MKRLPVNFTPTAEEDLLAVLLFIAEDSPAMALAFLDRLEAHALSLGRMARRAPLAAEAVAWGEEVRVALYGRYRILYGIEDAKVFILRVVPADRESPVPREG